MAVSIGSEFSSPVTMWACGAAHVKQSYAVDTSAKQIMVNVKNGTSPFMLTVQPNGVLTGSGTVDVAGRIVTGASDTALTYAPKDARCTIGTLSPSQSGTARLSNP